MSRTATAIRCAGCGAEAVPSDPFRCPRVGTDDIDHVLTRWLDADAVDFPQGEEADPFVRYRTLFHAWHLARANGISDADYVDMVERLDKAVAEVDGHGFAVTPFSAAEELSKRLGLRSGRVWVKDETGNVSGSHKARHLMGVALLLRVMGRVGLVREDDRPLAIASCGNAALAAAVVARAADRRLEVFVPTWAEASIVDRLERLGADVVTCERRAGVAGDPTFHALEEAVAGGAIPFTCQGTMNGLTIEGGETLGYEIVSDMVRLGISADRLFVQVGGGALASSCIRAFDEAVRLGVPVTMPRIHAVQTAGGSPLKRAYDRVVERILGRLERESGVRPEGDGEPERADLLLRHR
ncbi:MAG TPA: pyridoxal-phosphate dependent enzyme, partial [Actinomycetota bacterium]|nr:pyridoxal-phosphate dependent enzyme [Actinomycetota bacterium]